MDSSSSSSSSRNKKVKLSVRKQTLFKKPSTSLLERQQTILKKAGELSTLCDNLICVIHYDRLGNLVKTWPEDESQVQEIAGRYSQLTDEEKRKKNTNLSKFLNKKMHDEKKRDRVKFSQKVQDLEGSLVNKLQLLQDMLPEPDQNRFASVMSEHSSSGLINVPDHQQSSTNLVMNGGGGVSTSDMTNSLNHQSSKFSIFMFNHDNATFTQLPPHSSLDQTYYNDLSDNRALLGAQGFINVGYDSNSVSTQGFNFGYDNNSVSSALPGDQVNFGCYNSLGTQGFGYDSNSVSTQGFNFGYDNNSVSTALPWDDQVNFGCYNSLGTQGFGYDNNNLNTQGFNNLCT